MPALVDLAGKVFNNLQVLERVGTRWKSPLWLCICLLDNKFSLANSRSLKTGNNTSCGCIEKIKRESRYFKLGNTIGQIHGHAGMKRTPTYFSLNNMIQRCTNSNYHRYKDYGGRGIKVCKSWLKFENFLKDMGIRPEGKTLDRKNNNGNYCKSNCKWSTPKEQANNRR